MFRPEVDRELPQYPLLAHQLFTAPRRRRWAPRCAIADIGLVPEPRRWRTAPLGISAPTPAAFGLTSMIPLLTRGVPASGRPQRRPPAAGEVGQRSTVNQRSCSAPGCSRVHKESPASVA
jgi:hypothetical protein